MYTDMYSLKIIYERVENETSCIMQRANLLECLSIVDDITKVRNVKIISINIKVIKSRVRKDK